MQKTGGHYIIGEEMRSGKDATEQEQAMSRKGRYHRVRENLHVKDIVVGDGEARKRYVLVYNPKEAERDRAKREQIIGQLQHHLDEGGLPNPFPSHLREVSAPIERRYASTG